MTLYSGTWGARRLTYTGDFSRSGGQGERGWDLTRAWKVSGRSTYIYHGVDKEGRRKISKGGDRVRFPMKEGPISFLSSEATNKTFIDPGKHLPWALSCK